MYTYVLILYLNMGNGKLFLLFWAPTVYQDFTPTVTYMFVKGVLYLLPQKAPKLACFVFYLKIINILSFLKNDICI